MNLKTIRKRTIFELEKSGIKTASIDVDILLKDVLDKDDAFVFSHPELPLTNNQYQKFRRLIQKRKTGHPIAYLIGHKEFFGLDFIVNKNVLIPRPETELLVELALKNIELRIKNYEKLPLACRQARPSNFRPFTVLDIGTGSGNIIISILKYFFDQFLIHNSEFIIRSYATDIHDNALNVAKKNAKIHKVHKNINFFKSDLFNNKRLPKYYDLILANLPYVPKINNKSYIKNNKVKDEIFYEPQDAIFADNNGSKIIKRFLDQARDKLNMDGMIILEADPRNIKNIQKYALKYFNSADIIKDLSGRDRFLKVLHN